jgi:predicted dehydrogenase
MAFLQSGIEDVCFLALKYPDGPLGHIHVSWLDPIRTRKTVIVGSQKMAVYDDTNEKKLAIHDKGIDIEAILGKKMDYDRSGEIAFSYKDGDVSYPSIPWQEPLKVQIRHFLECICQEKEPLTGVSHARQVVEILECASKVFS